jgi:hypothetical protein
MAGVRWEVWLVVLVAAAAAFGADGAAPTPATPRDTQVVTFRPAVPSGRRRSGDCWTESAAVDRPEAWRCMAGNSIYDPCFSVAELQGAVVCGADPARGKGGFVLQLTKPLPAREPSQVTDRLPWMLRLADGSICEVSTSTTAQVDGQDVPYECSDSRRCTDTCPYLTGVTSNLSRGAVWKADKVAFRSSPSGMKLLKRTQVAVVTAWQ